MTNCIRDLLSKNLYISIMRTHKKYLDFELGNQLANMENGDRQKFIHSVTVKS